jgi:hypothetical protein
MRFRNIVVRSGRMGPFSISGRSTLVARGLRRKLYLVCALLLVPHRTLPDLQRMKLCGTVGESVARSAQVSFLLGRRLPIEAVADRQVGFRWKR